MDLGVSGEARITAGLIGRGILESRTPWMHECEGAAQNLGLRYLLLDFSDRGWGDDDLAGVVTAAEAAGFAGLNVTYPFKQAVIPLLDELAPEAAMVGAVNTIAFRDGRRIGHNTDVSGFASSFREGLSGVAVGTVLQMGCGGAGSATASALLSELGASRVLLQDPQMSRARDLATNLARDFGADRVSIAEDTAAAAAVADGIVNASPIGMTKFPGTPLPVALLEPRHWVADVVYFPLCTALLQAATQMGCRVLNGGGMAVHQAADAFVIFTGFTADRVRMNASFSAFGGSGGTGGARRAAS